jgi:hypothetical protein
MACFNISDGIRAYFEAWLKCMEESDRTKKPFSSRIDGHVKTYHPTGCKCPDVEAHKAHELAMAVWQ